MDKNHGSLNTNDVGPSQLAQTVKNLPANAGDVRDTGSIPGSGRALEKEGNGNPLQYSSLGNSMNRGEIQIGRHEVELSRQLWLEVAGEAITENGLCY